MQYGVERILTRFCGSVHIFPIEVYKRIPKEMTRVHIFYADGSNRTIDTGAVSIL